MKKPRIDNLLSNHAPAFFAAYELMHSFVHRKECLFLKTKGNLSLMPNEITPASFHLHCLKSLFMQVSEDDYLSHLRNGIDKKAFRSTKEYLRLNVFAGRSLEQRMEIFKGYTYELWAILHGMKILDPYEVYVRQQMLVTKTVRPTRPDAKIKAVKRSTDYKLLLESIHLLDEVINYKPLVYWKNMYKYRGKWLVR